MVTEVDRPKIILISQWPKIKNAEYQLIENIKRSDVDIRVVDYLGFDVETGENINDPNLSENYDFALALHFDTPNVLNICCYLWVSNPLEYLFLKHDYFSLTLHNYRSFEGYFFNEAWPLKRHVKNLLGEDWIDEGHEFYPSVAEKEMLTPLLHAEDKVQKLFYCGINWEYLLDKKSRNEGLLHALGKKGLVDIFGPNKLNNIKVWKDFKCYMGEVDFDGEALKHRIKQYAAVLAISSPAHFKSETSSSRVFEGFSAGVPVISDENPHVKKLFGDSVYYFRGKDAQEKSANIEKILSEIKLNPEVALRKVKEGQALIQSHYTFEHCLNRSLAIHHKVYGARNAFGAPAKNKYKGESFHVFLFHHDSACDVKLDDVKYDNFEYCLAALENAKQCGAKGLLTVVYSDKQELKQVRSLAEKASCEIDFLCVNQLSTADWDSLKLGSKLECLIPEIKYQYVTFFNAFEYPHFDYFVKALPSIGEKKTYISGSYYPEAFDSAPEDARLVRRFNQPEGSYRWSAQSANEHQLGRIIFSKALLTEDFACKIAFFDLLAPIVAIILSELSGFDTLRGRHITVKVVKNQFNKAMDKLRVVQRQNFWAAHYLPLSNYDHEINAGYDLFYKDSHAAQNWLLIQSIGEERGNAMDPYSLELLRRMTAMVMPLHRVIKKLRKMTTR